MKLSIKLHFMLQVMMNMMRFLQGIMGGFIHTFFYLTGDINPENNCR